MVPGFRPLVRQTRATVLSRPSSGSKKFRMPVSTRVPAQRSKQRYLASRSSASVGEKSETLDNVAARRMGVIPSPGKHASAPLLLRGGDLSLSRRPARADAALGHLCRGRSRQARPGDSATRAWRAARASAAAAIFSIIASCRLHRLDLFTYLDEILRVLPYWPRERYLELSPKQWSATRARLRPEELAVPLSAFEVPAVKPAVLPSASATA
jgi:hypothetical protein